MGTTTSTKPRVEIINVSDDGDDDVTIPHSFSPSLPTNKGTNIDTAISVENYFMQQAIMASMNIKNPNFIDLDEYPDHNFDVQIINSFGMSRPNKGTSVYEVGESSNSKKSNLGINDPGFDPNDDDPVIPFFICEICVEDKLLDDSFSIKGCCHSYCSDCVFKYVDSRIQENVTRITCPVSGCNGVLELEDCRAVLPRKVFDRWGDALCEALILGSAKFYCPFKDCSAVLIMDGDDVNGIVESECPFCRRMFCAQCKVPWHSGVECGEFQKLHKDEREHEDIMLLQLAKNNKWSRCPRCKFYVERSSGCLFMKCRCGYTFCYNCGAHLVDHYCRKCKH